MSLKEKIMDNMMDKQFSNMTSEERQAMMDSMMDKFFSSMTDEEKQSMMKNMMPKMMGKMMDGEGGHPMMGMMGMMMGSKKGDSEGHSPMDRCMEMMQGFKETANTAKFATPELRSLFDEWCALIEKEILDYIKETGGINSEAIAKKFALSEESVQYLLSRLASKKLIDYKA